MCINYQPIRLANISKLGMAAPTFDVVNEAWPNYLCPIIVSGDSDPEWQQAKFGLLPNCANSKDYKANTVNACLESISSLYSYSQSWMRNQFTLIPLEAFYEPNYLTGNAIRWRIEREDQEPFTIAGIWDSWSDSSETIRSFSILTMNADNHPIMQQFHKSGKEKRSPIIIPPELRKDWLTTDHRTAHELLHEIDATQFTAYPFPIPPRESK